MPGTQDRYAFFRLRTECSFCGHPLPLNEIAEDVHCNHCLQRVSIPLSLWSDLFARYDDEHEEFDEGEKQSWQYDHEGLPVRVECGPGLPVCEKCGSGFSPLHLNADYEHVFHCMNCGDPASTQVPPGWMSGPLPTAKQLIFVAGGESPEGTVQFLDTDAQAPSLVAMNCPSCGGGLKITAESTRLLPCEYCRSEVYIPDPVWRRLHPVVTMQPIYVRYQGLSRRQRAAEDARILEEAEERMRIEREAIRDSLRETRHRALMAQAEQAQAETDARVDELVSSARTWSIIACAFWAALVLWSFSAESSFGYEPFGSGLSTTIFLFIGTGVASLIGMHMVSRPIQESTGNPGHWLLFETWFWLFMLPVPVVGILMALFRAFVLFRGRISASHIQVNNSHYSYEAVEFQRGESQPAAWLFLALGLGLPLTLLGLVGRIVG